MKRTELFENISKGLGFARVEKQASQATGGHPEECPWFAGYSKNNLPIIRRIEKYVTGMIYKRIESLQVEKPKSDFEGMSSREIYSAGQLSMLMQVEKGFDELLATLREEKEVQV